MYDDISLMRSIMRMFTREQGIYRYWRTFEFTIINVYRGPNIVVIMYVHAIQQSIVYNGWGKKKTEWWEIDRAMDTRYSSRNHRF